MQRKNPSHGVKSPSKYVEHSVELLKKAGARVTKPRLAVLKCLAGSGQCLSPKDILRIVNGSGKALEVDLATIYRILEAFSQLHLVHKVGSDGEFMACAHLECESEMHMIAHCSSCDRIQEIDLPDQFMGLLRKHVQSGLRFNFGEHCFQMNGTCSDCSLKRVGPDIHG